MKEGDKEPSGIFRRSEIPHRVAARLGLHRGDEESTAAFQARAVELAKQLDELPTNAFHTPPSLDEHEHTDAKHRLLRARPAMASSAVMIPLESPGEDMRGANKTLNPERGLEQLLADVPASALAPGPAEPIVVVEPPAPKRRPPFVVVHPAPVPIPTPARRNTPVRLVSNDDPPTDERPLVVARPGRPSAPPAQASRFNGWDWLLFVVVSLLELVELFTMYHGTHQFLPLVPAVVATIGVLALLWIFLTHLAGKNMAWPWWHVVVVTLSLGVIYMSTFTYYEMLAGEQLAEQGQARAKAVHARLVGQIYTPRRTEADSLRAQSNELLQQASDEAARGGRTGAVGYGPVARALKADGDQLGRQASALEPTLELLAPHATPPDASPVGLFEASVALWQSAPAEWRAGVPLPERGEFIDEASEIAILRPVRGVLHQDVNAITALVLSGMVSGMAIVAGTGIESRKRVPLLERLTRWLTGLVVSWRTARSSWRRALTHEPTEDWIGRRDS